MEEQIRNDFWKELQMLSQSSINSTKSLDR